MTRDPRPAITGTGRSAVGRRLDRDPLGLAVDGCLAAIEDAGLTRDDIDGVAAFVPDDGSVGVHELQEALGLELDWYVGTIGGPSQLSAVWEACLAVASGAATHVLAFHASCEGSVRASRGRGGSLPGTARGMPARASGAQAWWLPFGAPSAVNIISMYAQRHFHEFGTTREQLGQLAVVQRENAGRNPDAIYRDPLTIEDYLAARMVSEPLCLYDCDVPTDFCSAVIVSRGDAVGGLRRRPVRIDAVSTSRRHPPTWEQADDLTTMLALRDAGSRLWERTSVRPGDIDVAGIYDGFSFITLAWLEALGFCGRGEGGAFLEGGDRIRRDGELPINTEGGQLSAGRMHGWGFLPEVCRQLWGEAGERQVPGGPEVGLVAAGGGIIGAAAVLLLD
ncbi:acetyl-CoA acetyltransferase [Frankia sp. EI5c]|uniref:thiolase family protein n=1 Tax=Frankia sp. EI5c TaxID=683316 RepID=UPI0007C3555B|nr:thiolase family protein [Frankia sp. EI5c]OAA27444.1 acetyl-CoA acetyltransferase [Frankia sp. EI5c]